MTPFPPYPTTRPRRLRRTPNMRDLVRETDLSVKHLVYPIFIRFGHNDVRDIPSMPGQKQWTLDYLEREVQNIVKLGIQAVMPFGLPEHKDAQGSDNLSDNGLMAQAIRLIKKTAPDLLVLSDMCLCDYAPHGHCTIIDESNKHMLNEPTLDYLRKASVVHARAGSDIIVPSGMIDGMVAAVRGGLNDAGFIYTPILTHAAKYASAFYGPFREALESAPAFGNRTTYQMDPGNIREALKEVSIDIAEGADIVMVKPALPYLDVIKAVHDNFQVPVAAYQVSGEYAMIHAAAANGWVDLRATTMESLTSIRRAGASIIVTYFAKDVAQWLNQ